VQVEAITDELLTLLNMAQPAVSIGGHIQAMLRLEFSLK
jgi:hypothetical protein